MTTDISQWAFLECLPNSSLPLPMMLLPPLANQLPPNPITLPPSFPLRLTLVIVWVKALALKHTRPPWKWYVPRWYAGSGRRGPQSFALPCPDYPPPQRTRDQQLELEYPFWIIDLSVGTRNINMLRRMRHIRLVKIKKFSFGDFFITKPTAKLNAFLFTQICK